MAATLVAAISSALAVAFKARDSAENAVEPGRTVELSMEMLRADLEAAIPPNTSSTGSSSGTGTANSTGTGGSSGKGGSSSSGGTGGISGSTSSSGTSTTINSQMLAGDFQGQTNVLDFYSLADSPEHVDGNGEIKQVEFALETQPGSNDQVLVRRVLRNIPPLSQNPLPPDEEVICRGVTNFSLRYFDGSEWQDTWDAADYNNVLPAAVEVTLELQRPGLNGQPRVIRTISVFSLPCSTIVPGSNAASGGTGLPGF